MDILLRPFLERIAASIAYYKGFIVRGQVGWSRAYALGRGWVLP